MTFPFAQENAASRRRLETLVRRLSEADLARSTHYGWTVAALLAHLAFWDQRMVVILKRWKEEGFDASPIDSVAVNDALKVICHALEPRSAAELARTAAEQIDAELAALPPDLFQQIEAHAAASSTQFRMNRSLHRNAHLDDIELLLSRSI
jgi:hypothetical protein